MTAARLTEISTAPGEAPYGFTITATGLGAATTSPVRIGEGTGIEDEAPAAHVGSGSSDVVARTHVRGLSVNASRRRGTPRWLRTRPAAGEADDDEQQAFT